MTRHLLAAVFALLLVRLGSALASEPHRVTQFGKKFSESEMTVTAGDTVVFINHDDVVHNIFSTTAGFRFNLKRQAPGTASGVVFASRGKATVRCAIHPTMQMTVVVE